ncbi:MAG: ABC transporter ATP-binding protein [Aerococcaceae bacterium]|nr:ABC transporter ATP-binding protein [Aerococcaceae bacterium]
MIQELWNYIKQHKKIYLLTLVFLAIDYGVAMIPTKIVQKTINAISANELTLPRLYQLLGTLALITIISYVAQYAWIRLLYTTSSKYKHELRMRLFRKIIKMRIPFYEKFRSGDMMTRFTNDINDVSELLGYGLMSLLFTIATILVLIPTMFAISWKITLVAIIPFIIMGGLVVKIGTLQEVVIEENREAVANLSNEVLEVVEGIRVTRAYGKKELGAARFQQKTAQLAQKADKIMYYQAMYGRLSNVFIAIGTISIIGLGGYFMQQGTLQLGDVVALQLYSLLLIDPMWMMADFILIYQSGSIAFGKLLELLTTTDEMEPDGNAILEVPKEIRFKDYSFSYQGSAAPVLQNLNITLKQGQTLGIVGKTGSGKTTLVRQLLRQYPAGTGEFLVNGQPITHYQRQSVEQQMGYVPQEHVLFSRTVQANIEVGKANASQKEVDYSVAAAAFSQDLLRMKDGYETLVGEKGVSISGGQKQRISIARAFIKDPAILILDDSLSAVDARTERIIIENIQALREGKTNIIVTHRLSAVSHADWVIVLDEGRIVEEGTPDDLLAQKGWYYEQYERQQLEEESA